MWIIPKTLSAFVQDTEGLNLDLDERAWMLESSAMWRSKPSSKPTWLRRLKKDAWMTRLSTRILKPSLRESFEEKYTASLEDIPVSRSVAQESEKERKTQDTYGHISESMSGQLDLFGAFSRMSEVTPRWGYGESCPIWKKMVTERSGDCSRRRKQARLTNASDASSWPTASARDHKGGYTGGRIRNGKVSMDTLDVAVQAHTDGGILSNWATPVAMNDGIYVDNSPNKDKRDSQGLATQASQNWPTPRETMSRDATHDRGKCNLGEVVHNPKNWPTPRAGNPGSRKPGTGGKILAEEAKIHAGPPAPEKSSTSGKNHGSWPTARSSDAEGGRIKTEKTEKGFRSKREKSDQYFGAKLRDAAEMNKPPAMKLNPNWVKQLMGLPIGWTDLGSWATESSPKPQK